MAGPGPVVNIDNGASKWGAETNTQKMIGQAAQYNPATKLGITNGDQPAKTATAMPTSDQIVSGPNRQQPVGRGFGPSSGLEPAGGAPPVGAPPSSPSFTSRTLAEHYAHLAALPEASPIIQFYARRGSARNR